MNFKLKDIGPQLMTVIAVVLVFGFFTFNAQVNMENRGIDFGFGFLSQESSFDVQFSLIEYDGSHSYFRAYLVGLLNTILVSVIGIILATILGVLVGIARLSPNYLINKFAAFYVIYNLNYLDGGTYKIPPLVHNSFGPLSGKIPVSAIFLL